MISVRNSSRRFPATPRGHVNSLHSRRLKGARHVLPRKCERPLTAEDTRDAEEHRGTSTIKTRDIDSLRVLCVLRGEEVLYVFTPSRRDAWARSTAFLAVPLPVNSYAGGAGCEPHRSGIDPAVCVLSWGFRLGMAVRNPWHYQGYLPDCPGEPHILAVLPQDRERQP